MNDFDWSECRVVWIDEGRLSGAPAFEGTRVPVSALFSNLASGATIEEFLEWFPPVTREQVSTVMDFVAARTQPRHRVMLSA